MHDILNMQLTYSLQAVFTLQALKSVIKGYTMLVCI